MSDERSDATFPPTPPASSAPPPPPPPPARQVTEPEQEVDQVSADLVEPGAVPADQVGNLPEAETAPPLAEQLTAPAPYVDVTPVPGSELPDNDFQHHVVDDDQ